MKKDVIDRNLALIEAHFHSEATSEVEKALELYTDDIVWESPARNLVFHGKEATGENYRRMFSSFHVHEFRCLERFATQDRVVDDSVAVLTLTGNTVQNAPVPAGSKVEIRLLHIFDIRDGKISRELVFENWKVLQPAVQELSFNVSSLGAPVKALSNGIILSPASSPSPSNLRR